MAAGQGESKHDAGYGQGQVSLSSSNDVFMDEDALKKRRLRQRST